MTYTAHNNMERIEKEEEKKELITSSIFFSFSSF
jgi:hypothetical protein